MSTPAITPKPPATVSYDAHFLTHIFYLTLFVVLSVAGYVLVKEHDARVIAEQTIITSEQRVVDLEAQIKTLNSATAQQVAAIRKTSAAIKTTPQAIPAIQDFDAKLNARAIPTAPLDVQVAAVPLAQDIEQCRIDRINLDSCSQIQAKQNLLIASKDDEIKALKKKPRFFKRVVSTLKTVGIGVVIGVALVAIAAH